MILVESLKSSITLKFLNQFQAEEYCDKRLKLGTNSFSLYSIEMDKKNQIKSKKFIKVIQNVNKGAGTI